MISSPGDFLSFLQIATTYVAPVGATILSVLTYWLAQRHTKALDARTAAKDTVDILVVQNKVLRTEVSELRRRLQSMETVHAECQKKLADLSAELEHLRHDMTDSGITPSD